MNTNKNYIGAALVALAFVGAWGWILPEYNRISELGVAINERQALFSSRSAIVQRIQTLNNEYQQRSADVAKISSVLPSKKSLAEIVSSLDKITTQNGLQIVNASIIGRETGSQTSAYTTLPISISLNGSYRGLVSFLQSVEKNIRIMDVASINASSASAENPGLLNLLLLGNTYYLK